MLSTSKPAPWTNGWIQQASTESTLNGIATTSYIPTSLSTFAPADIQAKIDTSVAELSSMFRHPHVVPAFMEDWLHNARIESLSDDAPEGVLAVEKGCRALGLRDLSRFYKVESDYYDWTLQRRMLRLVAPSIAHLCKSVIMENTHFTQTGALLDPINSKYYCVIVQYISKLNTQKLINFVYSMNQHKSTKLAKKDFNLRVADEELSLKITGHTQNGVSPIGMQVQLPIILSESITKLQPLVFFMGGGHVDWKLALPVKDFIEATKCFVLDTA